tara:strand:- start:5044 stop:5781 length:738 start_codon:yes stop_codon:yes gene_type:complete
MKRFKPWELFEINKELSIQKVRIDEFLILIIDNFYVDPTSIRNYILEAPLPIWKYTDSTLNFKQYYDCRHIISFYKNPPYVDALDNIISHYYNFILKKNKNYSFITNVFQWKDDQPAMTVGNRTHTDGLNVVANNIFLNLEEECSGGTAIYRSKLSNSCDVRQTENWEEYADNYNIHEDGSVYYDISWPDHWFIETIIPMKFNRCIIYPGYLFHGAYHTDNNFKNYPRVGQTCFLESELPEIKEK